jgi:hypothetical protein
VTPQGIQWILRSDYRYQLLHDHGLVAIDPDYIGPEYISGPIHIRGNELWVGGAVPDTAWARILSDMRQQFLPFQHFVELLAQAHYAGEPLPPPDQVIVSC